MLKKSVLFVLAVAGMFLFAMPQALAEGEGDYADSGTASEVPADESMDSDAATEDEGERTKLQLPAQKKIKVIQKRAFSKKFKHLLEPYFGINPSDSLNLSIMEGLRYNVYFTEELGLQLNFAYVHNFKKDLYDVVEASLSADEASLVNAKMQYFFNIDFMFIPVYGKFSLMSEVVLNYDFGLYIGAGAINYKKADLVEKGSSDFKESSTFKPCVDAGVFFQMYVLSWLNIRADFAYYYSIADFQKWDPNQGEGGAWVDAGQGSRHNYMITLGIGFLLPPS